MRAARRGGGAQWLSVGVVPLVVTLLLVSAPGVAFAQTASAPDPPDQPRGSAIWAGMVDVHWNEVAGADSYDVQYFHVTRWIDLPAEDIGVDIAFYGAGAVVKNLSHSDTYQFRVRAVNSHGASEWSELGWLPQTDGPAAWSDIPEPTNVPATGKPYYTGTLDVGELLTVDTSSISDDNGLDRVEFHYQWIRSDGTTDADIEGATGRTYTISEADAGRAIKLRVSFTDRHGFAESLVHDPADNVSAEGSPIINGTPTVKQTLSADTSPISDRDGLDNVSFEYQWISVDGGVDTDIDGATNPSYTLVAADVGKTIKVRVVFADDRGYEESLTSATTEEVAPGPNVSATGLPSISGTPEVLHTLTADTSAISDENGLDGVTFNYQWVAVDRGIDTEIQGATSSTYTLAYTELGKAVKVQVTFVDNSGNEETQTSAATGEVAPGPNIAASGSPTISGTLETLQTLTADISGISDANGLEDVTFNYQWIAADGDTHADIEGATGPSYTLASTDLGKTIKVRVDFLDNLGYSETLTSVGTSVVAEGSNVPATGLPIIVGTAEVLQSVTVDTSGIADEDGMDSVSFEYQWIGIDDGTETDIPGATSASYALTAADRRKTIKVRVSFDDDRGYKETLTSAATASVSPVRPGRYSCRNAADLPTPTDIAVTAVPIVVQSTTSDYFVLYAKYDSGDVSKEMPVKVVQGQAGTTTLSENVPTLPASRYRVEKYLVSNPADVDGDCVDDITELGDSTGLNPVNPTGHRLVRRLSLGTAAIPDRATFERLAYEHRGAWQLKFMVIDLDTDQPSLYFSDTTSTSRHNATLRELGITWNEAHDLRGTLEYRPATVGSIEGEGVYTFTILSRREHRDLLDSLDVVERVYALLAASLPVIDDDLGYLVRTDWLPALQPDLGSYQASRVLLVFDSELFSESSFIPLNPGEGYGLLREMGPDDRPGPRDIAIYESLPNELPRVAGIISTVPQTPLSHVNLRAAQDSIPNAYISDALSNSTISDLLDRPVYYQVTDETWHMRAATLDEMNAHFDASRPETTQQLRRVLTETTVKSFSEIGFDSRDAYGVKASNLAVLGSLGFPAGTVPTGYAVPFYFYDEFMKQPLGDETLFGKRKWPDADKITLGEDTTLTEAVDAILAHSGFQTDIDIQVEMLDDLRDAIKDAASPQWIIDALTAMHANYPADQSLRYRSSTNNEDLPGFNGAGLHDSKTQHPDETDDDGVDKSLKQVYASLWNYRAFAERDFNRVDHQTVAMGVAVHPNYEDELVNGVAVSTDPLYGFTDSYYVNSQVGEDLVTNPEAESLPEELMLHADGTYTVLATSNLASHGQLLMTNAQLTQLRNRLNQIHDHFASLYSPAPNEPFAIEIEFKITSDNVLAIKQARPWIFSTPPVATTTVTAEANRLTAQFHNPPATHNGSSFEVEILYSARIKNSFEEMQGPAFEVTGGRIERAARREGDASRWLLEVQPDGDGDVTVVQVPHRPCTVQGGVCTTDGLRLSTRLELVVGGPAGASTTDAGNEESLTGDPLDPSGPDGLVAAVSGDAVVLTWNAPVGFDYLYDYQVLRHRPELGEPEPLVHVDTGSSETTYTDTDVEPGVLYVYQVKAANYSARLSKASEPVEIRAPGPELVWESELTVGQAPGVLPVALGYTVGGGIDGTLSASRFRIGGTTYTVELLLQFAGSLWLGLDRQLPADFTLALGDSTYQGSDSKVPITGSGRGGYWWPLADSQWADAESVQVSLNIHAHQPLEGRDKGPLIANLTDIPTQHDGRSTFTFELRFSEEPDPGFSYKTLRDHAFTVTGGSVVNARRLNRPSNIRWEITVEPGGNGPVTIVLPATTNCDDTGAICTEDGRMLFNRVELMVAATGG